MKQALLIVDIQHGLFAKEPSAANLDVVFSNINLLAKCLRVARDPVIFIQHEASGTPLAYNSPAWQLDARLEIDPRDIQSLSAPVTAVLAEALWQSSSVLLV